MPLHLLGKKSWNVYNQPNIDRVRRDESEAAAREGAEEQRQQENDAARRLAILRGEAPPPLLVADESRLDGTSQRHQRHGRIGETGENSEPTKEGSSSKDHHGRRQRKRYGEDDTDFEMRLAQDQVGSRGGSGGGDKHGDDESLSSSRRYGESKSSDAPIVDHAGHIDLFPDERDRAQKVNERRLREDKRKNPDAEREKARNKRELEDQYTMRFSNAAGRDAADHLTSGKSPWYAGSDAHFDRAVAIDNPRKDAFGREDPSRKVRDEQRVEANDPLSMMKRGAAKVREVEKERQNENEEREREARALRREERKRQKRRRRHGDKGDLGEDVEPLDGFSLDQTRSAHDSEHRSSSHHGDRRRSRSHRHRDGRGENRLCGHRNNDHHRA